MNVSIPAVLITVFATVLVALLSYVSGKSHTQGQLEAKLASQEKRLDVLEAATARNHEKLSTAIEAIGKTLARLEVLFERQQKP